jgi:peroxiredoxin Q/BCP
MTVLNVGDIAPMFKLKNQDGNMTDVADSLGQLIVIYFYPKALTPGCTTQACDLRNNWKVLEKHNIKVFGISPDKPELLKKFQQVERIPFQLLSDFNKEVANIYGTWQEKSMYGRKYMGMSRDTFIIDRDGSIISMLRNVKPKDHFKSIITTLHIENV